MSQLLEKIMQMKGEQDPEPTMSSKNWKVTFEIIKERQAAAGGAAAQQSEQSPDFDAEEKPVEGRCQAQVEILEVKD